MPLFDTYLDVQPFNITTHAMREIVSRLPYAIFGPASITHIPLYSRSQEDELYIAEREKILKYFKTQKKSPELTGKRQQSISDSIQKTLEQERENGHGRTVDFTPSRLSDLIEFAWKKCQSAFSILLEEHISFLVFEADSLIGAHFTDNVHRTDNDDIDYLNRLKLTPAEKRHLHIIYNAAIKEYLAIIYAEIHEVIRIHTSEPKSGSEYQYDRGRMGGLISQIEKLDRIEAFNQVQPPGGDEIVGSNLDDRKMISLSDLKANPTNNEKKISDANLIWRRGEQNWRYTFTYGNAEYPNDIENFKLREFVAQIILSDDLQNCFPKIDDQTLNGYMFPGYRMAGAQYFMIPVEILLTILHNMKAIQGHFGVAKENTALDINSVTSSIGTRMSEAMDEIREIAKCFGQDITIPALASTDPSGWQALARMLPALRRAFEGCRVAAKQSNQNERKYKRMIQLVGEASEIFWKLIYRRPTYVIDHDDFVMSEVLDGSALYISNFRPFDFYAGDTRTGFTRTLFVEMGLTPYQRGRLVRRLCDVATFRMSSVRDIDRIRAMQDGINRLNREFGQIVVDTGKVPRDDTKALKSIWDSLDRIVALYRKTQLFNMYVTEGVSGRKLAVQSDFERVSKHIYDIREERIHGYATLGDFIERGLAITVNDVRKTSDRYDNLVARIRDHMSMMRTKLAAAQSMETSILLTEMDSQSTQQTRLLRTAEILVYVGGAYYLTSLFKDTLATAYTQFGFSIDKADLNWPFEFAFFLTALVSILAVRHTVKRVRRCFLGRKAKRSGKGIKPAQAAIPGNSDHPGNAN